MSPLYSLIPSPVRSPERGNQRGIPMITRAALLSLPAHPNMATDNPMSIQSLTTPAMFMVSAEVLPINRNTAMLRAVGGKGGGVEGGERVGGLANRQDHGHVECCGGNGAGGKMSIVGWVS